jgi:polyisoprenoid-binding protein YceI
VSGAHRAEPPPATPADLQGSSVMPKAHAPHRTSARGGIATVVVIVVVILGAAGFAGYWFFVRSDAAPKPEIEKTETVSGGSIDGAWKLTAADAHGSFVQYRVHEQFADGLVDNEATGKSTGVTGSMTINGTTVADVTVTANLAALHSDKAFRDNALKSRGLETDKFPTATFVASGPVTLPSAPVKGRTVTVEVPGRLTLHGVTRTVTVPIEGRWDGETVQVVVKALPISLTDYGMTPPTGGPIAEVDDHGDLEMQLFFTQAG